MGVRAISHVAVGVRDMERSLRFWRDALGLAVKLDTVEELPGISGAPARKRRAAYLGWSAGPHESFVVLDQPLSIEPRGEPAQLFTTGVHHFSFWVDDIAASVARVRATGFDVLFEPAEGDTIAYGEAPGGKVLTTFLRDPDGNFVQLDQRA
ncbi:MAG TPA: VOC family protein [Myxococcota bacterium]|nr:VOC family protein [Myxococcota bacterium]